MCIFYRKARNRGKPSADIAFCPIALSVETSGYGKRSRVYGPFEFTSLA
jgi:hypothetical protein